MALSAAAEEHLRMKSEQAKRAEQAEHAIETSGEEGDGKS